MGAHRVILLIVSIISLLCLIFEKGHTECSVSCMKWGTQSDLYLVWNEAHRVVLMVVSIISLLCLISETESTECSVCYSKQGSHSTHTPPGTGGPILCMLSETWHTEYFVRYLIHGWQSDLYDARKPPHRVLCAPIQTKHTELYSA